MLLTTIYVENLVGQYFILLRRQMLYFQFIRLFPNKIDSINFTFKFISCW